MKKVVLILVVFLGGIAYTQTDSLNVRFVGACETPGKAKAVYVSGSYAYVADCDAGLRVIDVSIPSEPLEIGSYDPPGMSLDVFISGNYAYVANLNDLLVIDVSIPSNPQEVGYCDVAANDVHVVDPYAYVALNAWDNGLRVVDVSVPSNPHEVGSHENTGWATDVYVASSYAYVTSAFMGGGGLQVIDVSTPSAPQEIGYYTAPSGPEAVCVSGSYAYIANHTDGLRVIDVSRPERPQEISYRNTPEDAQDVYVSGLYAYVSGGELRIFNISTPSDPQEVGYYNTPGYSEGVYVSDPYVYIADGDAGLGIYENLVLGVKETTIPLRSSIQISASLNRLSYDVPNKTQLTLYSADGRKVFEETVEGKGIWEAPAALPQGVYFAQISAEGYSAKTKLIVIK
jgi:hypothetical protein